MSRLVWRDQLQGLREICSGNAESIEKHLEGFWLVVQKHLILFVLCSLSCCSDAAQVASDVLLTGSGDARTQAAAAAAPTADAAVNSAAVGCCCCCCCCFYWRCSYECCCRRSFFLHHDRSTEGRWWLTLTKTQSPEIEHICYFRLQLVWHIQAHESQEPRAEMRIFHAHRNSVSASRSVYDRNGGYIQ